MRIFDTKVQYLKYKVLREVARHAWSDTLLHAVADIPGEIAPGPESTMYCCVYKERAILSERVRIAMGGKKDLANVIEVIDIACDECPASGFEVTNACRGCLAHRCEDVCPRDAISYDEHQKAHIDKDKCIGCGMCARVCPYSAITKNKRPCENACKVGAIRMSRDSETKEAVIDEGKCISCGACVYQCPFGAITDKSYILEVIRMLRQSVEQNGPRVYAIVAPSISGQFRYAKLGQVVSGIRALGFAGVMEVALGADLVAKEEAAEWAEKKFLTTSCCPAFVEYIKKQFPAMAEHISTNPSPMARIAQLIKEREPEAKVVFIGPCTAKKMEVRREEVRPYVDSAITFEELQALFASRDLDIPAMEEMALENASYFGRIFARSGGVSAAVQEAITEQGMEGSEFRPLACDGIEECRTALLKASKGILPENFIEGMACMGGCIGGAGCLTHGAKNKMEVDKYSRASSKKTIAEAVQHCADERK